MEPAEGRWRDPSLVGRTTELDQIGQAFQRLAQGLPAVVEILGEPGMGKSRLLAEISARAESLPVLRARSTEYEQAMPFALLAKAFQALGTDPRAESVVRTMLGIDGGVKETPRHEVYRTARSLVAELASPHGVAILLDDLHWGDADSLALLEYLLTTMPSAPVLVAIAYRPRQMSRRFVYGLSVNATTTWWQRIDLHPLPPSDAGDLIGGHGTKAWQAEVVRAAGGNPLYVLALAHAGPDAHERRPANGRLPSQLSAALFADVDAASPAAQLIARAAAVAGDSFDPSLAVEISGLEQPAALAAIDELFRRDVLRREPDGPLCFRHPLLRRLVYDSAPPAWLRAAHRTAILSLRSRGASVLTQAPHIERSAGPGDLEAVELLLEAAELTGRRAPGIAARWLRAALDILPATGPIADRRADLHLQLAECATVAGQLTDAREILVGLTSTLPPIPDPRTTRAILQQAGVDRLLGDHNEGRRKVAAVLAELRAATPRSKVFADVALELAAIDVMEGTATPQTRQNATEAGRVARACGDLPLATAADALVAMSEYLLGEPDRAIELTAEAARQLDAVDDRELVGRLDAVIWTGWAEVHVCRFLEGLAHLDRGTGLARESGQVHVLCHLLTGRALALRWLGRLPEALASAEEAVDVARLCGSTELVGIALGARAWVATWTGDLSRAREDAESLLQIAGHDKGWWAAQARFVLANVRAESGDLAGAGDFLLTAGGGPELPAADPLNRPLWYELLVRAEVAGRNRSRALELSRKAAAYADRRLPLQAGFAALAKAHAARPNDPAKAAYAQQAAELFTIAGGRLEVARAAMAAGSALAAAGQITAAARQLETAAAGFAACQATTLRTAAERELTALTATDVPPAGGALSKREREVAELVSRGCTNRQIAERLHVTEKTVETHMSRIFTKLNVSSRAALAAWVGQRRAP